MIFLIGFFEDEVNLIREIFNGVFVYEILSYCCDWVFKEIVEKVDLFKGSGNWYERKFFFMYDLSNDEVREVLGKMKFFGFKGVIYVMIMLIFFMMKFDELIEEWFEEDVYFC